MASSDMLAIPAHKVVADDILEMLGIARCALLDYRRQLPGGGDGDKSHVPLTIWDVDRFDDLSAIHGIRPISAVHVEGRPISWHICELIVLATLHVVNHVLPRTLAAMNDAADAGPPR